jgi:processive 1,2-diacylglycerol beta-glucosyltransferase
MNKILIAYATAGIGHKKAAIGIKKAFDELKPSDTHVELIDTLDYTTPYFKKSYLDLYLLAINKLSLIWGTMYYLTDIPFLNIFIAPLRRLNNWYYSRKLVKYLIDSDFDVIISTHFFLGEVAGDMKRKGRLRSHLINVVTDYRLHAWWVDKGVDLYTVAGDDAEKDLIRWGVPPSKIKVMGIPVEPVFSRAQDKDAICSKYGLKNGVFTVLVIGGGFGVGPIEDIVKAVNGVSKPVQAIVICGHNEELVKKMEALKASLKIDLKVLGFVDNVYDFMDVSDVLVSKAGGITTTESLAKELPVIIIAPIPGQETRNSEFLTSHGAAVRVNDPSSIKDIVEALASDPEKERKMKEAIRKIRKPTACFDIAKLALEIAGNRSQVTAHR